MAPRSCAAQHPSSRSPTLSPDDLLKLPASYCGGSSARFAYLSRTKRRPAAATQALSSGEVPTAVALHASLVTLNVIEGFGSKKLRRFLCTPLEEVWLRWLVKKTSQFLAPYGRRSYSAPTLWRATFQLVVGIFSCFHRNRCVRL